MNCVGAVWLDCGLRRLPLQLDGALRPRGYALSVAWRAMDRRLVATVCFFWLISEVVIVRRVLVDPPRISSSVPYRICVSWLGRSSQPFVVDFRCGCCRLGRRIRGGVLGSCCQCCTLVGVQCWGFTLNCLTMLGLHRYSCGACMPFLGETPRGQFWLKIAGSYRKYALVHASGAEFA